MNIRNLLQSCVISLCGLAIVSCGGGRSVTPTPPPPLDTKAPELNFNPSNLTVVSTETGSSTLTATDNVGITTGPDISCTNAGAFSGGLFTAPSTTTNLTVECTATASDAADNEGTATLIVTVTPNTTPPAVSRTVTQIAFIDEMTVDDENFNINLEFYRNEAYEAGLSTEANPEYYTFMVINPNNDPNVSAPLWVWLHGGAQGYFDELGAYQSYKTQDENSWNHEESFDGLWQNITVRTIQNGQLIDNTLKRRIQEGYRILVVSYSDHDWYSGLGTIYPNNPANPDAQVNGLQATMAAIDYTAANYPTTHAWLHGTSAGSIGAWSATLSYQLEGRPVTGLIGDSGALVETSDAIFDAYLETGQLNYDASWRPEGIQEKVGYFANLENQVHPKAQINTNDFRASPGLWIAGLSDPALAANLNPVQEAIDAGFDNNAEYLMSGVNQAINDQIDSPHELHFLPNTGHVPTNKEGSANELVNNFIDKVLATNPPSF